MITPVTFDNQLLTAALDSRRTIAAGIRNAVVRGCGITYDSNNIYVAAGDFFIEGRQVRIPSTHTVALPTVTGTIQCYLVATCDLSQASTESSCEQIVIEVLTGGASYPSVVQQDLLANPTGKYQMILAKFTLGLSGITELEETLPDGTRLVSVPVSGWSGTAPYTQTVSVSGITDRDNPLFDIFVPDGTEAETGAEMVESGDCVNKLVTNNGTITLYCYAEQPTATFWLRLRGV